MRYKPECLVTADLAHAVNQLISSMKLKISKRSISFRCPECYQPVNPNRAGKQASAHLKHIKPNPKCSLFTHVDKKAEFRLKLLAAMKSGQTYKSRQIAEAAGFDDSGWVMSALMELQKEGRLEFTSGRGWSKRSRRKVSAVTQNGSDTASRYSIATGSS